MSPEILEIKNNETTNTVTQEGEKFDGKARAIALSALIALSSINASAEERGHPLIHKASRTPEEFIHYLQKNQKEWEKVQTELQRMGYSFSSPQEVEKYFRSEKCNGEITLNTYTPDGEPLSRTTRACESEEFLLTDPHTKRSVLSTECGNGVPGVRAPETVVKETNRFIIKILHSDCRYGYNRDGNMVEAHCNGAGTPVVIEK
ncbi:hypothetical protein IPN35_06185 [Candidatus Peregrinibacteria bacterium]|nr:MAG: hypothetical protein IPN35_06185 [Candidatus Peregrinibacteria bacterium]